VRSSTSKLVLSFAALAVMPVFGIGAQARAGHIGAKFSPARTALATRMVQVDFGREADLGTASCEFGAADFPAEEPTPDPLLNRLRSPQTPSAWLLGHSQSGGGFGGSSSGSGANGAGQQVGLTAAPSVPELELAGLLFLADAHDRPPPFPCRLFRPPHALP
jgi:hypothetical protein